MVAVRARVVHRDPLPIPHVYQQLPPFVRAVCTAKADLFAHVVCLHARQGKAKFSSNIHLAINTAQILHNFDRTMLCFVNFDSQQPSADQFLEVTLHQLF